MIVGPPLTVARARGIPAIDLDRAWSHGTDQSDDQLSNCFAGPSLQAVLHTLKQVQSGTALVT